MIKKLVRSKHIYIEFYLAHKLTEYFGHALLQKKSKFSKNPQYTR